MPLFPGVLAKNQKQSHQGRVSFDRCDLLVFNINVRVVANRLFHTSGVKRSGLEICNILIGSDCFAPGVRTFTQVCMALDLKSWVLFDCVLIFLFLKTNF